MSRVYSWLFWLAWPVVRRHLEGSTFTSCWLEAWLVLRNDRHRVGDKQRATAMMYAKALEEMR